jgi:hypothetical protein
MLDSRSDFVGDPSGFVVRLTPTPSIFEFFCRVRSSVICNFSSIFVSICMALHIGIQIYPFLAKNHKGWYTFSSQKVALLSCSSCFPKISLVLFLPLALIYFFSPLILILFLFLHPSFLVLVLVLVVFD